MHRHANLACRWIAIGCLTIIAVIWIVTYQRVQFERDDDIAQAIRINDNLALALEEQTIRTFKMVDQTLRNLRYAYRTEGAKMPPHLFQSIVRLDPEIYSALGIIDEHGDVVHGAPGQQVNLADREYFAYHRDNPDDTLRVGGLIVGRVSGKAMIQLTRRISRPDGSFGGVVASGILPSYFSRIYGQVDLGPDGMVELVGLDGINYARHSKHGVSKGEDMRGTTLLKLAAAGNSGHYLSKGKIDGIPRYMSFRVLRDYGLVVAVGTSAKYVLAESGERTRWYLLGSSLATLFVIAFGAGIVVMMQRQKRTMKAAIAGQALYRVTFDQAAVGITHNALDGRFLKVNSKYCAMTGYSEAELLGRTFMELLSPEDVPNAEVMQRLIEQGTQEVENRYVRKDGAVRWCSVAVAVVRDQNGKPDYLVAMVQDITERKRAEAEIERNAHYDALTGLPNRALLFDRLSQTLKVARRTARTTGVLFVDLDRFKNVNDTLGHENGDLLLRAAAQRLSSAVRTDDTVARIGGDEFVLVLSELADAQHAAGVAQKIIAAMAAPFELNGREVFVTASVGIAVFPGDGPEGEALVNNANAAMLRAKQIGRNNYQFYTASLNGRTAGKLLLEADLRRALERNEFELHYQPKVALASGRVVGFEALLRWRRVDGKLVSPGEFVPLLEESGMIADVGDWVIRTACAQIRAWQRDGLAALPIAVNVSAKQFLLRDLYATVDAALRDHGIEGRMLEIEITESDAMQDSRAVMPVLARLRERGVRLAIDDFGTGFSSLGYLAKLPVHTLKIDRSFVIEMHGSANARALVATIISLAHSLHLKVVAEGVETDDQSTLLRMLCCDEMQGYLFSRPVPAAECVPYLDPVSAAPRAEALAA